MPFTDFWGRWRSRHGQHSNGAPNLRETEKQREAAERQAAEQMARSSSSGVREHHHSDGRGLTDARTAQC